MAAGTARLWWGVFAEGGPAEHWSEGVTDLQGRRTSVVSRFREGGAWDHVATTVAERWPWLDSDADADDDEARSVYLGSAQYFLYDPQRVVVIAEGDETGPRSHSDPTWIVDALASATAEQPVGRERVRDVETDRYAVTFEAMVRDHRQTLRADVWVDAQTRLRRAIYAPTRGWWRRPGRLSRRWLPPDRPRRSWTMLELWDFGVPVAIPTPQVEPRPRAELLRVAYRLWQMRRAWKRSA